MNDFFVSALLGTVEGITEFLPISSTGHLILVNEFTGFTGKFANMFDIVIQMGAILSVVVYFRDRLLPFGKAASEIRKREMWDIWKKTIVGVLPALAIGAAVGNHIEELLFNPIVVSSALLIGGIALILIERKKMESRVDSFSGLSYKLALAIGLIQCLAMIPGTSRSAATIIGAMLLGASRLVAAEFSFFLAIPTLSAASAYSLMKSGLNMTSHEMLLLGIGFVTSFFVAWGVIAAFMSYISKRDFKPFGYYRIILGLVVLGFFVFIK
jgi:undecaprenyl-diphosphatase